MCPDGESLKVETKVCLRTQSDDERAAEKPFGGKPIIAVLLNDYADVAQRQSPLSWGGAGTIPAVRTILQ